MPKKMKKIKVKAHTRTLKPKAIEAPKEPAKPKEYGDVKLRTIGVQDAPDDFYNDKTWSVGVLRGRSR